jgi:hypothetical protein
VGDPLVLYRADSIDALAAAEQKTPGAELVAIEHDADLEERLHDADWVLGLTPGEWKQGATVIDPTPDASIVVQVWRKTRCCKACGGSGQALGLPCCLQCQGEGHDPPPTWLRYLDDAVCERWALIDSRVLWTYVMSFASKLQLDALKDALADGRVKNHAAIAGSAILRARKRWEEERDASIDEWNLVLTEWEDEVASLQGAVDRREAEIKLQLEDICGITARAVAAETELRKLRDRLPKLLMRVYEDGAARRGYAGSEYAAEVKGAAE